jgi:putative hydrolase of the HAD superfamily
MSGRSASPIRAIFFDAGNTLLRMNYPAIAAELAARGIRVTPEHVQRAEWRARVRLDEALLSRRAPGTSTETPATAGRYLRFLLEELGVTDEAIVRGLTEWRRAYNPPVGLWNVRDPDAPAALSLVRGAGLRAAVISNSNGSIHSILEALGLAAHLDFVLDSFLVGVEKPDPRIFRLALERAGLEPAQAVYVGDLYSIDVVGARAAGMGAVLLDPGECWGARDCPAAPDLMAAVRMVVDGAWT